MDSVCHPTGILDLHHQRTTLGPHRITEILANTNFVRPDCSSRDSGIRTYVLHTPLLSTCPERHSSGCRSSITSICVSTGLWNHIQRRHHGEIRILHALVLTRRNFIHNRRSPISACGCEHKREHHLWLQCLNRNRKRIIRSGLLCSFAGQSRPSDDTSCSCLYRQITGITLARTISNSIFLNEATNKISHILPSLPRTVVQQAISGADGTLFATLNATDGSNILEAIVKTINDVYGMVIAAGGVAIVLSLFMRRERLFEPASAAHIVKPDEEGKGGLGTSMSQADIHG